MNMQVLSKSNLLFLDSFEDTLDQATLTMTDDPDRIKFETYVEDIRFKSNIFYKAKCENTD